ncbi:MAG: CRISPR-associated protein Cas4 [Thermoprotei archaeon]|nr:MAG: CRISPR-associated protein Cas4 [Thermoprotei archaeon]
MSSCNPAPTPWLVKQYIYCPVIPWIIVNYGVQEPLTESMKQGKEEVEVKGEGQVRIRSRKYGFQCVIDEVKYDSKGKPVIVEYKKFKPKKHLRYKIQLLTYTLAAQETIGPVRKAVLIMGSKKVEYEITEENLKTAKRILRETEKVLNMEKPPIPKINFRKCSSCWYRKFCPYM